VNVVKIVSEDRFSQVLQHLRCFLPCWSLGEQLQPAGAGLIHTEDEERDCFIGTVGFGMLFST